MSHAQVNSEETPSVLRTLYNNSVSLFDAGIEAGMQDARRGTDKAVYNAHMNLVNGIYGVSPISKSFSQGYVYGFSAVRSGVMS